MHVIGQTTSGTMIVEFAADEYKRLETHLAYRQIVESNTETSSWSLESVEAFWNEIQGYRHGRRTPDKLALAESASLLESFLRKHLRPSELDLLLLRFGFETGDMIPVSQAVRKLGVSRSAYDQIFRRLRHPYRYREIKPVLNTVFTSVDAPV